MYRQLYQMGGIGTLPMDFGQPLQVSQPMMNPSFAPMQPMSNPMSNYGQTPLTMAGGGITRLGYQEGGMNQMMMEPQMQEQTPQINPLEIKAKQALELIIQMLIERGIPPEQAREIAIQMVQAVAEGGMGEMEDQRIEARFGGRIGYARGGINNLNKARQLLQKKAPRGEFLAYINPREAQMLKAQGGAGINVNGTGIPSYGFFDSVGDFFGDVAEGVGDFVGGAVDAVKDVVGSDLGKAALTIAAIYASGGGFSPEGFSFLGAEGSAAGGLFGSGGAFDLGSSYLGQGLFGTVPTDYYGLGGGSKGLLGNLGITSGYGADLFSGGISSLIPSKSSVLSFLGGTALGGFLGGPPKREDFPNDEEYQKAVARYKAQFQTAINDPKPKFPKGQYPNNPFYPQQAANGGRIGYQEGGIGDLIKQVTQQEYFGKPMMAIGGRMQYGLGSFAKNFVAQPVSATSTGGDTGGGGMFGNMISRLIRENPDMFKPQSTTIRSPRTGEFIDVNQNGIDDRDEGMMYGGRIGYALGAEVPTRQNQAGITELDYRQQGGFVPPIGIKEKADDIPAMLSNNEFVFTADAVRNAGGGDVNRGAKRMYGLMKNLEAGGIV